MSIKIVFITHMHIDHNLGILLLIKERTKAFKKKGKKI